MFFQYLLHTVVVGPLVALTIPLPPPQFLAGASAVPGSAAFKAPRIRKFRKNEVKYKALYSNNVIILY